MSALDQSLSATADARGHKRDVRLTASTNSPHMHTSPPITYLTSECENLAGQIELLTACRLTSRF